MTDSPVPGPFVHSEEPALRFSVVIPTFNRGVDILPTIDAVRSQDFDSYEIIVVNDGSTDDTVERLTALTDDRLMFVSRANGGISAARNTGAQHARGQYVVPLDDDDVPNASWLSGLDQAIGATNAAFASCGHRVVDWDSHNEISRSFPQRHGPMFGSKTANLLAGTFAVRRDVYFDIGGFEEGLQSSHQTEFALRLLPVCDERGWGVESIDQVLVDIRRRGSSDRFERSPVKLLNGMQFIIDRHEERLALSPGVLSKYHGIAGVAAFRLGRRSVARHHLWAAWRADPFAPTNAGRYLISLVPPIGRRVWGTVGDQG